MNILFSEIILLLHLLIFLFITLSFILIPIGYFQKWEWVKNKYYRSIHLILMGIISIETILGFMCPLTILENYFRDDIKVDNKLTEIAHQILYWDLPNYQFIILYILSFSYLIFLWFFFKPNLN
tara:strand:- start:576 stop:947 length:372 start_codon:yes stop_codon:yes gene_type:complete